MGKGRGREGEREGKREDGKEGEGWEGRDPPGRFLATGLSSVTDRCEYLQCYVCF